MPEYDIIATHVVRQGETLDLIARQYYKTRYSDAAVERLVRCNMGLIVSESMGIIQPGMNLRIPSLREQEK